MIKINQADFNTISNQSTCFDFLTQADQLYFASLIKDSKSMEELVKRGVKLIIDLKQPLEQVIAEKQLANEYGMTYLNFPINDPSDFTPEVLENISNALDKLHGQDKAVIACRSANRVGAWLAMHLICLVGLNKEKAIEMGKAAGLVSMETEKKIRSICC